MSAKASDPVDENLHAIASAFIVDRAVVGVCLPDEDVIGGGVPHDSRLANGKAVRVAIQREQDLVVACLRRVGMNTQ